MSSRASVAISDQLAARARFSENTRLRATAKVPGPRPPHPQRHECGHGVDGAAASRADEGEHPEPPAGRLPPDTSAEGAAFFPEAGELDDRFEVQPWAKVNTMGRQLTALSQARAEGAARFPEADEPGDRFEAQGPGGACGAEDTPTTSARGSSPGTCSSGAPRPAPGLPAPRRWLAAAARDRGAGGPLPRAALRRGPRAPQPTPAETEVLVGNLPGVYSEQMLLEELRDAGFRRGPDFGALRLQAARHGSRLRCLIRFHTVFARNAFVAAFHGRKCANAASRSMTW
ncbi:unnamed protein product [Prorocentrum cordatum]|uniref:RRM domain-containing protein n=1 Tax=Prorocentrum cordatum TaxID=2364126 RepID=A0ABN9TF89_9DINO|nr:unnamed protein product [Polarella glacialis]